ncbi:hypothetical protein [Salibacter halophilus]|uniref:Lipoprotein n=1 Tax=Salibacter halophilus TaxID=1803916 RepID=A0A6N6MBK6_9FLAO|nr:hypothetical protein [Salibacter halophilus]KAB1064724.1 hypothetical protein F3059_05050 [Salibacter halophilus]
MIKHLSIFIILALASCKNNDSIIDKHVKIAVHTYEKEGKIKASAMPELRSQSELQPYKRRFEYLLINVSEIHLPERSERRKEIWSLYPDTTKLKRLYLKEYVRDKKLKNYFETTSDAITGSDYESTISYSKEELMEVASKFFYCDKVFPDTSVQTHICVGLNGVDEANWEKDYTLLEAFCYEGIFNDLVKDSSQIDESYSVEKTQACKKYRDSITSLDEYLKDVRSELFSRMKNDAILERALLDYYGENEDNLAFRISE